MAFLTGIEHDPMERIQQFSFGRSKFFQARLLAAVEKRRAAVKYVRQGRLHQAPSTMHKMVSRLMYI